MRLLSLNVEGARHTNTVFTLVDTQAPDILCFQEAPDYFASELEARHYHTSFTPLTIRQHVGETFPEGLLIASKQPHNADTHYYHRAPGDIQVFEKAHYRETMRKAVLTADIGAIRIATTHFTWTEHGNQPNAFQKADMETLLATLTTLPPHVICGDFNIPRRHNPLYSRLTEHYTDAIPATYASSLDRTLHRHSGNHDKQQLFTDYMVDYIFTQPPYTASEVELIFNVSDHAAVLGTITHNT